MKKKNDTHDAAAESPLKPESESSQAANPQSAQPVSEIPIQDRELAQLREDKARLEAQLQRAMADLSNVRKRHGKDVEEMRRQVLEGLAKELLPVLDNFHLALSAHELGDAKTAKPGGMIEGLRMVKSLLQGTLERHGVVEIQAQGLTFDPNQHEAVGIAPTHAFEPGKVAEVLQRGYALGDRVIRPTRVLVAAPPPASNDQGRGPNASNEPRPGS